MLIGNKGYGGDGFRAEIVRCGAKRAYKGRTVIERCFCRLKDFRRVATRTTSWLEISWPPFISPLSSHIGSIESGP
jgi:transposase